MTGTLFIVATPIGNLEDISARAIRILKEADLIACEDTRTSGVLLSHFQITTPVTAYHKFNEKEKSASLIEALSDGKNVALITDAGTPVISDPGSILIRECRRQNIPVTSVPGPCALITALTLSGEDTRRFVFEGFLPIDKKEKSVVLASLKYETRTVIFYEAPHRLQKTLSALYEAAGNRRIILCRELTKKFETVEEMSLSEAVQKYTQESPRGEYVLVLEGKSPEELKQEQQKTYEKLSVSEHVALYEQKGCDHKEAMKLASSDRGVSRREIYQALLKEQEQNKTPADD